MLSIQRTLACSRSRRVRKRSSLFPDNIRMLSKLRNASLEFSLVVDGPLCAYLRLHMRTRPLVETLRKLASAYTINKGGSIPEDTRILNRPPGRTRFTVTLWHSPRRSCVFTQRFTRRRVTTRNKHSYDRSCTFVQYGVRLTVRRGHNGEDRILNGRRNPTSSRAEQTTDQDYFSNRALSNLFTVSLATGHNNFSTQRSNTKPELKSTHGDSPSRGR